MENHNMNEQTFAHLQNQINYLQKQKSEASSAY